MAKYEKQREEEVKNKVAQDYFSKFDHTNIIGNIDFCIAMKNNSELLHSIMWAEAKQGIVKDINESFVQLILTIGKSKTFNKYLPPPS